MPYLEFGAFKQEKALVEALSVIVKSSRTLVWSSALHTTNTQLSLLLSETVDTFCTGRDIVADAALVLVLESMAPLCHPRLSQHGSSVPAPAQLWPVLSAHRRLWQQNRLPPPKRVGWPPVIDWRRQKKVKMQNSMFSSQEIHCLRDKSEGSLVMVEILRQIVVSGQTARIWAAAGIRQHTTNTHHLDGRNTRTSYCSQKSASFSNIFSSIKF